jgi:hypothetical protein
MRVIIFFINLVLVISCEQQTGNSHSHDKVTSEAIEQSNKSEDIDLNQFTNFDTTGADNNSSEGSDDVSFVFSESDGELLTNASLGVLAINCRSCHAGFPTTNQGWIDSKYITSGDAEGSLLIDRIKGCGRGDQGDNDMPTNSGPISEVNCNTLKIWVEYLHQLENESL